jgi:tyrosyl-tRNA synthetase
MIGDQVGKVKERNLLTEETLDKNIAGIKSQLEKYINFDPATPQPVQKWSIITIGFKPITFIDFLRDTG